MMMGPNKLRIVPLLAVVMLLPLAFVRFMSDDLKSSESLSVAGRSLSSVHTGGAGPDSDVTAVAPRREEGLRAKNGDGENPLNALRNEMPSKASRPSEEELEVESQEDRQQRFSSIFRRSWEEFVKSNKTKKTGRLLASGGGSLFSKTQLIRACLPRILNEYSLHSILDLPCGDFGWMYDVLLNDTVEISRYTGADIVPDLIEYHQARTKLPDGTKFRPEWEFINLDGVQHVPPTRDLVFTRDLLQHISPGDIKKLVANLNRSGAKYWLVSNFPQISRNSPRRGRDGSWDTHLVNLLQAPYNFPPAVDECPDTDGKRMQLWKLPIPGY